MKDIYDFAFEQNDQKTERVVLLGASMGSIVGQYFVARYPGKIAGFLNVDGVAHPFFKKSFLFEKVFGTLYKIESFVKYTGIFRLILWLARNRLKFIASRGIPLHVIIAQFNDPSVFMNVAREMKLMMDLCEYVLDYRYFQFELMYSLI